MENLTEEMIDNEPAGWRLNSWIAEHIFDWQWVRFSENHIAEYPDIRQRRFLMPANWRNFVPDGMHELADGTEPAQEFIVGYGYRSWASSWDGAWQVWAKMPEAKALDEAGGVFSARFHCEWGAEGWELGYYATGDTAPLAICKAALKVVMLG